MEIKPTSSNDQRPSNEIVKQWWPAACDEFDANPDADSHCIWVVACLLYSAREATSIIEKAEELLYLCQNFRIPCEGDSFDRYEEYIINPMFPEIKGKRYISGLTAKLSKETVSKYLHDYREWPLTDDIPLSKWWKRQISNQIDMSSSTVEQPDKGKRYISGLTAKLSNETVSKYLHDYREWPLTDDMPLSKWGKRQISNQINMSSSTVEQPDLASDNKNLVPGDNGVNSDESPKDSIINFAKAVLLKYPDATTADMRRYCFDEMNDLVARRRTIINKLLIKAGVTNSKRGVSANKIDWSDKYPKAQWERAFERIKIHLKQ